VKDERIDALFNEITVNIFTDLFAMTPVSKLYTGRDPALRARQAGSLNPYVAHADIANEKKTIS